MDRPSLGTLAARAHDLLSAGGHPLAPETLIEHVFGINQSRAASKGPAAHDFWRGQLARLLADPATFTQYADGNWGLTEWGMVDVALDAMSYVVVDCETTGLNPQTQRVIEIAAIRCRGRAVLERFETLINPERAIPQAIRQLTGITPALLGDAPRAPEALRAFLDFAGADVLVGHNVRFDLNFLGAEAMRHHHTRLLNPSICTIRLASRLLPSLKRPNLDNLARALDLRTHTRHRAMGDAAVTQEAFWKLVELARERGIATQGRLQALIGPSSGSVRAVGGRGTGRHLLDPALRQGLPTRPGVYLMKDERGTVIYVGKAKNLKQRIASYYAQPLGYRRKMDGLLEAIRDLETIVVGSELEALIKESQLIKAYMPQFNVQQRYYRHYPFIKVEVQTPFPRVYAAREVVADGARYFGPFRSKRAVDTVIELIHQLYPIRTCTRVVQPNGRHRGKPSSCLRFQLGRCLGPCMGVVTPQRYHMVIEEVMAFLSGGQQGMLRTVEAAMYQAAERQDFERAGRLRDALAQARQLIISQELLTGAIERNNLVIVCPSVEPCAAELFGIRHGRLYEQCTVPDLAEEAGLARVSGFLLRLEQAAAAPLIVGQEEIDAIIIIGRWLARYGESAQVVRLPERVSLETAQTILATARRIHQLVASDGDGSDLWEDQP